MAKIPCSKPAQDFNMHKSNRSINPRLNLYFLEQIIFLLIPLDLYYSDVLRNNLTIHLLYKSKRRGLPRNINNENSSYSELGLDLFLLCQHETCFSFSLGTVSVLYSMYSFYRNRHNSTFKLPFKQVYCTFL